MEVCDSPFCVLCIFVKQRYLICTWKRDISTHCYTKHSPQLTFFYVVCIFEKQSYICTWKRYISIHIYTRNQLYAKKDVLVSFTFSDVLCIFEKQGYIWNMAKRHFRAFLYKKLVVCNKTRRFVTHFFELPVYFSLSHSLALSPRPAPRVFLPPPSRSFSLSLSLSFPSLPSSSLSPSFFPSLSPSLFSLSLCLSLSPSLSDPLSRTLTPSLFRLLFFPPLAFLTSQYKSVCL